MRPERERQVKSESAFWDVITYAHRTELLFVLIGHCNDASTSGKERVAGLRNKDGQ